MAGRTTTPEQGDPRTQVAAEVERLGSKLPHYSTSLVWFLMAVTIVDSADRTVLATVFEDIRRAFDVSDSQLGLLAAAYAFIASLSVIPCGFLADRMNRVHLIALGFIPWGIAMMLQGAAGSFVFLFGARMLLGTVEATNIPSTASLIGDYYPVERRSSMYGLTSMSATLGYAFGLTVGGAIASAAGWRMAFVIWGVLGIVTAGIILKVLPEPERGLPDALYRAQRTLRELDREPEGPLDAAEQESLAGIAPVASSAASGLLDEQATDAGSFDYRSLTPRAALSEIMRIKTFWLLVIGELINAVLLAALGTWIVTYFRRYYGLNAAAAAGIVALGALLGVAGVIAGNRVSDRLVREDRPQSRLALGSGASIVSALLFLATFGSKSVGPAAAFFVLAAITSNIPNASLTAPRVDVIVPHLRGRAEAVRGVLRLVGTTVGPLLFGILSDLLGLRQALMATVPFAIAGAVVSWLAIATFPRDFAHAQRAYRQNLLEEELPATASLLS